MSSLPAAWYAVAVHPAGAIRTTVVDPWKLSKGSSVNGQNGVEHFSLVGDVYPTGCGISFSTFSPPSSEYIGGLVPQWKINSGIPVLAICSTMSSFTWTFASSYLDSRTQRVMKNITFSYSSMTNEDAHISLSYTVVETDGTENVVETSESYRLDWQKGRAYVNGTGSYIKSRYFGASGTISPVPRKWDQIVRSFALIDDPLEVRGEIVRRCADDAQYIHSNLYEFFKDLPSFGLSEIQAIQALGKKPGLRNLASTYLGIHYGSRLTVAEAPGLWGDLFAPRKSSARAAITRNVTSVHSGISAPVSVSYHGKVFFSSQDDTPLLDELQRYGILPSIRDIWETIPLSFAADWFLDLSSRLSVYDASHTFGRFPVDYFVFSEKLEQYVPAVWLNDGWAGSLKVRSYIRTVSLDLPQPSFYNSKPTEFHNIVELGALLLQRSSH